MNTIKERLAHLSMGTRTRNSLTLEQFSKQTGIKRSQISLIENQGCTPSIKDLSAFSEFLGIKLWELISYLEEGTGEVENWNVTMSNPGDKYPWLRKYTYLHWLPDVVSSFCTLPDDTRRNLITKIKREPGFIEYVASTPKINKELIAALTFVTKEQEKK